VKPKTWHASVLTLFPEMFPGPLGVSLAGKAHSEGLWSLAVHDIRAHGIGKHRKVDDTPSGGGPGMVMRADVAVAAIDAAIAGNSAARPLIYLSPRGAPLTQARVKALAAGPGAVLLCGRFEGIDERAVSARNLEEISLGDFVLAGGEIAAMAIIESVVRLLPGVMGKEASKSEESFEDFLLEYPHYTRPKLFEGLEIPEILACGDHAKIAAFRREAAENLTKSRRPDLWTLYESRVQSARRPGSNSETRPPRRKK
jgi:tRNA (guanine37-N1)-methyltransferase